MITKDGDPNTISPTFVESVCLGLVPGWSHVEKFGYNEDVDSGNEDVWVYGGPYTYSTTADIDRLSSSDDGDTQNIILQGQKLDYTEVTQTATLTGQTPVALTTPMRRIYRMYNNSATAIAGTVYCFVDGATTNGVPDTASDVRAVINNGDGQTEMCLYTVPKGKQGFVYRIQSSIDKSSGNYAVNTFDIRLPGKDWRLQNRMIPIGTGINSVSKEFNGSLGPYPEGTDMRIYCRDVEAINTGVSGDFLVLLQDVQ